MTIIPRKGLLSDIIEEIVSPIIKANKRFKDKSIEKINFFIDSCSMIFQFDIVQVII
jgi:hypothetical protein